MMKRARADAILQSMAREAQAVNADDGMAYWVTRLSVFGSYLTDKPVLGDLDVAFELRKRWASDAEWKAMSEAISEAYPQPRYIRADWFARMMWPSYVIIRRLKASRRGVSMHDHGELAILDCPFREVFSYQPQSALASLTRLQHEAGR